MKIFQILNDICYWEATAQFPTLKSLQGRFTPETVFVEAPDHVFAGWGYIDGEFIQPELPQPSEWKDEGGKIYRWAYDEKTGTFYIAGEDGKPVTPEDIPDVVAALRDALEALAILGIEPEEREHEELHTRG